jgi:hypothetical protein
MREFGIDYMIDLGSSEQPQSIKEVKGVQA